MQVLIGGGENHRMGLFDMVMVKDNHIAVAGGIPQAISAVENYLNSKNLDIGVEVFNIFEVSLFAFISQVFVSRFIFSQS
jgi:nicotinate-nucleotide pyrophosphorylase